MNRNENIWTRQHRLQKEERLLLDSMRSTFKGMGVELDNDDFKASATSADLLVTQCIRQVEIETELKDVNYLVDGFDKLNERMEKLEELAKSEGWDGL
jgi:hypothetical protein